MRLSEELRIVCLIGCIAMLLAMMFVACIVVFVTYYAFGAISALLVGIIMILLFFGKWFIIYRNTTKFD